MLFTPLAPYETPSAIDAICENYNRMIENQELDTILLIPILYMIFYAYIHLVMEMVG